MIPILLVTDKRNLLLYRSEHASEKQHLSVGCRCRQWWCDKVVEVLRVFALSDKKVIYPR